MPHTDYHDTSFWGFTESGKTVNFPVMMGITRIMICVRMSAI